MYHMREGWLAAQRNAPRPTHPVEAEGWDAVMQARWLYGGKPQ
jgi:hypothetical protein